MTAVVDEAPAQVLDLPADTQRLLRCMWCSAPMHRSWLPESGYGLDCQPACTRSSPVRVSEVADALNMVLSRLRGLAGMSAENRLAHAGAALVVVRVGVSGRDLRLQWR